MTTLRVLIDAMPENGRAFDYALTDDAGRHVVRRGRGDAAQWPRAERSIAIVAAPLLYVTTLTLPPIGAARLGAAVRFALDDQLAAPADSMHVTHGAQQRDGRVRAFAIARDLMRAIVAHVPGLARVVAAPALFPADADWHWTFDTESRGFLLRADGSAVALAAGPGAPPEIALAINQGRRTHAAPARIVAHASADTIPLPAAESAGVPIVRGASWAWDGSATIGADAALAPDLRHGEFVDPATPAAQAPGALQWRPAVLCVALAIGFFAIAGTATWLFDAIDMHRDREAALQLARAAGGDAQDFDSAMTVVTQRYDAARHAAREPAPDDALPLLARAAPAFAALPPGTWKRAVYASGAWTVEFAALDAATRDALIRRLGEAGLTALSASTASGLRVRIQP